VIERVATPLQRGRDSLTRRSQPVGETRVIARWRTPSEVVKDQNRYDVKVVKDQNRYDLKVAKDQNRYDLKVVKDQNRYDLKVAKDQNRYDWVPG